MPRLPRTGLSKQQERVLEFIGNGRTNGEIATELGITLDGAKYHVSEILDKLGVQSREEAATLWRARRRDLPGRLRALAWPAGGLAAGVVATAAILGIVLFAGGGRSDTGGAAATSSFPEASAVASGTATLPPNWQLWVAQVNATDLQVTMEDAKGRPERQFTANGNFGPVAWSPDGSLLAAASAGTPSASTVTLFASRDWTRRTFTVEGSVDTLAWSSDGRYLAALGTGLVLYQPNVGQTIAVALPGSDDGSSETIEWSPGNDVVAVAGRQVITLVKTDGTLTTIVPPQSLGLSAISLAPWADARTVRVIGVGSDETDTAVFAVDLDTSPPAWEKTTLTPAGRLGVIAAAVRAAPTAAAGEFTTSPGTTADGAYGVVESLTPTGDGTRYNVTLRVYAGATPFASVELDPGLFPAPGGISAVVRGANP